MEFRMMKYRNFFQYSTIPSLQYSIFLFQRLLEVGENIVDVLKTDR